MSKEVIVHQEWDREKIDLYKRTLGKDLSDTEAQLAVHIAKQTGLDPLKRQIYFIKRGGSMTTQVGIDGLRSIAQRTGFYGGRTRPTWYDKEGNKYEVWLKQEPPAAVEIGVYNTGHGQPTYATALWNEYCQPQNPIWKRMPTTMLEKCAESKALRAAFSDDLGGLYEPAEFSGDVISRNQENVPLRSRRDGGGNAVISEHAKLGNQHEDVDMLREAQHDGKGVRSDSQNRAFSKFSKDDIEHRKLVTKCFDKVYLATNKQACPGGWRNKHREEILKDLHGRIEIKDSTEEDIEKAQNELYIACCEWWDKTKPKEVTTPGAKLAEQDPFS